MMAMMSVRVRLRRESSVTMRVSPFLSLFSMEPSLRSFLFFFPLTTSITQRSMDRFLFWAKRRISSCWLERFCLLVLTLR